MLRNKILKSEIFGDGMLNKEDRYSRIFLNHTPIMISENSDKIICIPDYKETFHIGFTAMSSKGKGIGGNTLLGFEYWMKKKSCVILNDFQHETFEYSLPCLNRTFAMNNLKIIDTGPIPYPIVYVFPSHKNLNLDSSEKKFPHVKMSLPTRVLIKEIENYYKLDKSAKYVTGYIDRFLECKDLAEIEEVLQEILEENFDKSEKKFEEMKFKIKTIFKNIFDEQITDSASPDAPSFLTVNRKGLKNYNNLTVQALIASELIPSIQTSKIRSMPWFPAYMAFIVQSIYRDKYEDDYFKNVPLSMYVPEIDKLWKEGRNKELIKNALSLIGTNGRMASIGLRWDAQDYDAIPDAIRSNTKFLFVLRKADSEEVRGIKKDFNVDKTVENWILSLSTEPEKGLFECVGLTADRFVIYNLRDGSVSSTTEPQKGRLITPLAHHRVPGVPVDDLLKDDHKKVGTVNRDIIVIPNKVNVVRRREVKWV